MSSLAVKLPFHERRRFQPHVRMEFAARDYVVKTVDSLREWYRVLRFRREIFLKEYGVTPIIPFGIDVDRFDFKCDQIVVQNKQTGELIGCYRVMCSNFHDEFYSEQEFDIDHVKRLPGVKVELGRACVHPDHRNGVVMQLLWRGIATYVREVRAAYAFGCTSVQTVDPALSRRIELTLKARGALISWPQVEVDAAYRFNKQEREEQSRILILTDEERAAAEKDFPPLLKFYLKVGAKICGSPALDRKFNCIDLFTLFDLGQLPAHMQLKYGLA